MQCPRCANIVADTVATCPKCGNLLAVDSYGVTSFAPVLPPPQPAAHIQQTVALGVAETMMSSSSPVPPTMFSNAPSPRPHAVITPGPQYAITPAPAQQPAASYAPTMHSGAPLQPLPSSANPYGPPYTPPVQQPYGAYPMMMPMQPGPMSQQGTPGLAVAALVCGLLGWIPFWIGFILCLLAITFGGIVLSQTRQGQPGRGLAIAGLVCGLVLLLPAACGL